MRCLIYVYFSLISLSAANALAQNGAIRWEIRQLAVDANEGIDIADFNRDGRPDVVAGRNWFAAPDFVARPVRLIDDWNGYVQSNGDHTIDINGDGWIDIVSGSFLPTEVFWYENPGNPGLESGQLWKKHLLVDTGKSQNEAQLLVNLIDDATPEWIVNSWSKNSALFVWQFHQAEDSMKLKPVEIGPVGNGHGLGVGDLNADGHADILTGQGWFENPGAAGNGENKKNWKYRPDWDLQASVPIVVKDVDNDKLPDMIVGMGHDFGLYWWKQLPSSDGGQTNWKRILIDDRFSQPHCLHMADLDGDGRDELITGKRVRAHNGGDPGADMPPCLYYYRWDSEHQSFDRIVIEEGHVGTGLQIRTGDLNQDGRTDIAVAGKSGTHILLNHSRQD